MTLGADSQYRQGRYCTETVTAPVPLAVNCELAPPMLTTTGTAPELTLVGIRTLICNTPATSPGASA